MSTPYAGLDVSGVVVAEIVPVLLLARWPVRWWTGPPGLPLVRVRSERRSGQFVRRRVEAGDPNFIKLWNAMGGA